MLSVYNITSMSFSLLWQAPLVNDRNGIIRKYLINVTELDSGDSFVVESFNLSTVITSLHPNYYYNFSISAVTVSAGPASIPSLVQTLEDG